MPEQVKKYLIQQKQADGSFLTLHPQTTADIVLETETKKVLTAAERLKLEGITEGAQVNTIESVKLGDQALTITSKTVTIPVDSTLNTTSANLVPNSVVATKVKALEDAIAENGRGITANGNAIGTLTDLSTSNKSNLVAAVNEVKAKVDTDAAQIVTNTANIATNTGNITTHSGQIGTLNTKVGALEGKVTTLETGKVDVVEGKGLSTEDFTSEEKAKLQNIAANAQVNVIEGVAGEIVSGSTTVNASVTTTDKVSKLSFNIKPLMDTKVDATLVGAAGGLATLDEQGKVPAAQLPSYVDDVIEGKYAEFAKPGEVGKIYVDTDTNKTYRWSGSQFVEISSSLALGITASTAYAGDKGKQNEDNIAQNIIDIAANKSNIELANQAISGINGKIGTADLNTDNKTIKEAINELHTELNDISSTVASNETVTKLSNAVFNADGTSKIAANESSISGINATLATVNTDIEALKKKDSDLDVAIAGINSNIETINGNISGVSGRVTTLEGTVQTHGTDIEGLKSADTALDGRIDKLESITGALQTKDYIAVNAENIAKNAEDIAKLVSGDTKAKHAEVADKLASAVSVSVSGDVATVASKSFDGSSNLDLEVRLSDVVAAGVYTAVQVDAKGRVVAGAKDIIVGDDQTDTSELAVGGLFFRQI